MLGIEFELPYIGKVYLRPQIFISNYPLMKKAENYYIQGEYCTALNAYKKSLLGEKDNIEVRSNIAACLLLLGDQYQAYAILIKLKTSNIISLFNAGLACAVINLPKKGLELLNFESKDPIFNLLKGILYHLNNEPVKAFEYITMYQENKRNEIDAILKNIKSKASNENHKISFTRGKEKIHKAINNYLANFFSKVQNKPLNLSSTEIYEDDPGISDFNQSIAKIKRRETIKESSSMILKNSKVLLKRMINPPQKRIKNLSPINYSPGLHCQDMSSEKKNFDTGYYKPPVLSRVLSRVEIDIDVDLANYKYIAQQSLEYIASEYNLPDKNIEGLYLLLSHLKFFAKHKPKIIKEFIRVSTYVRFEKDSVILKEGDPGTYIYVIVSGSVIVTKTNQSNIQLVISSAYDGDVIGDYSFIRKILDSQPSIRQATCLASETCHLIRINNSDMSEIIEKHFDVKNEYLKFIKSLPLFSNITSMDLSLLVNTVECKQFDMDTCILSAGEIPQSMFIVYRGRVKIKYPAKKTKYSEVLKTVQYSTISKELCISSGSFFGQRSLSNKRIPANYSVYSDNISYTTIMFITRQNLEQLFLPIQDHLLKILEKAPEFDLKVPDEYTYL